MRRSIRESSWNFKVMQAYGKIFDKATDVESARAGATLLDRFDVLFAKTMKIERAPAGRKPGATMQLFDSSEFTKVARQRVGSNTERSIKNNAVNNMVKDSILASLVHIVAENALFDKDAKAMLCTTAPVRPLLAAARRSIRRIASHLGKHQKSEAPPAVIDRNCEILEALYMHAHERFKRNEGNKNKGYLIKYAVIGALVSLILGKLKTVDDEAIVKSFVPAADDGEAVELAKIAEQSALRQPKLQMFGIDL